MDDAIAEQPDPYLWLEAVEGAEALAWVRAQSEATRRALCDAAFEADRAAIYDVSTRPTNIPSIGRRGARVYNFWQDQAHVRGLWRRTTLDEYRKDEPAWETVLDLDALARDEGEDWVWGGFASFEPEHRIGFVRLSRGGADAVTIREFDLVGKRFVDGGFALPEAKGGAAWEDADTLLVVTTLGENAATTSGYARTVRRWRRGLPFAEAPVVFEVEARDVWVGVFVDREPGFERLFYRRQITFEEGETFLARQDGTLARIDVPRDSYWEIARDWLVVKLKSEWVLPDATHPPDTLLAISFSAFMEGRRDFTVLFRPGPRQVLSGFFWGRTRLVLSVLDNLASRIFLAAPGEGSWTVEPLAGVPEEAQVFASPLDIGDLDRTDDFLLSIMSYVEPPKLALVPENTEIEVLKEAPSAFDASGLSVTRHEATADDGEHIPYFQIGPKEAAGPRRTVLLGYGGFAVPMVPAYLGSVGKVWLEAGNVWAVANIRGGGEFGAPWHKAGVREKKARSHDDFAAVARDLVARGVTTPERLAAHGGSNGGLLVGNMLTRYPDDFGAVWCTVPLLDMGRYTKLLAGPSWIAEYGDPDDPADWAFMERFSPYHNLKAGRAYPPVLLVTSRRDDRVHPGHARKMAARLMELRQPAFFYEPDEGGHGAANKEQAAFLSALGFSFLRKTLAPNETPSA